MAIMYFDYLLGDDGAGDGSAGNPYKTITQASIGLGGGDEVRGAKSTANVALTGTLGFTKGSTAVVGTLTLFAGELAIGDFVEGGDGNWWEVVVITDNTHATLYKKYSGATQAGISSFQLGVTSTGAAALATTQVQVVSASGASAASMLKISGGWDLAGPTQDGQTYFRQMHGVFANRWGYGLLAANKDFVELERLHYLRYDYGIYLSGSDNNLLTSPMCHGNGAFGIFLSNSQNNTLTTPICNANNYGVCPSTCYSNTITSPICHSNTNWGIFLSHVHRTTVTAPACHSNSRGIQLDHSHNNIIPLATCNDNTYGILADRSYNNVVPSFSGTGNVNADVFVSTPGGYVETRSLGMEHFEAEGDNRQYFEFGETYRETVEARSGACLKYDPSNAIYYISQSFFCKVASGVARTVKLYMKDDVAFNGDVQAALYFLGEKITGWSAWSMTTSYVEQSIIAGAGDITEDGILELRVKVRGTAGNVYADDFAYS